MYNYKISIWKTPIVDVFTHTEAWAISITLSNIYVIYL